MEPAWKSVDQGLGIPALRAAMGQRGVCGVTPQGFEGASRHGDANAVCRGTQRFSSNISNAAICGFKATLNYKTVLSVCASGVELKSDEVLHPI